MTLDLPTVRARFPALARRAPDGRPWVHADAPGGTQVTDGVIDAMAEYLRACNANSHGLFPESRATDELCARVREQLAQFLDTDPGGVVFGANMTTLTVHVARALQARLGPDDELVCTRLDHDANVAPWLGVAARTGARVRWVRLRPVDGTLDLASLEEAVTERTRLIAFPRASNALGTLVDPGPFVRAARAVGALAFMDAVHAAPHVPLRRQADGVDLVVCSPYKFFGPHAGILAADPGLLADLRPDKARPAPDRGPERWQTGTASFEAIAGIGAAVTYLDEVGMDAIGEHERALSRRFLEGLGRLDRVRLHGTTDLTERTPTFAVTVTGHHPDDVAERMAERGISVWSGDYYAVEPMRALGLDRGGGAVRIGFVHYHGPGDVDRVLEALSDL